MYRDTADLALLEFCHLSSSGEVLNQQYSLDILLMHEAAETNDLNSLARE